MNLSGMENPTSTTDKHGMAYECRLTLRNEMVAEGSPFQEQTGHFDALGTHGSQFGHQSSHRATRINDILDHQ
jgi:hypothetical protein